MGTGSRGKQRKERQETLQIKLANFTILSKANSDFDLQMLPIFYGS